MVPAKLVSTAVAMPPDAIPQLSDFIDQVLACHSIKIVVHGVLYLVVKQNRT